MRVLLCSVLSGALALTGGPVWAAPGPAGEDAPPAPVVPGPSDDDDDDGDEGDEGDSLAPEDRNEIVATASKAWTAGDWPEVRRLLEPLADDPEAMKVDFVRNQVLLLLADATLNDDTVGDEAERRRLAAAYLNREMDADSDFVLAPDLYTKLLFDLYVEVSANRNRDEINRCSADLMACKADVANERDAYAKLATEHAKLQAAFDEQEVEVRDRVARSRIFAAIPFGVGQFYNGDIALGATFVSVEVAFGATGLGLLLYRTINDGCRRTRGFQRGSLVCTNSNTDAVANRRQAEEAMGWFFIGTIALDILIAQLRFEPFETTEVRRVPRRELESGGSGGDSRRRRTRRGKKGKAGKKSTRGPTFRPIVAGSPDGGQLGVSIRF